MTVYRRALPQLSGGLFLADAWLETDLMFHHDIEIPEFAAHTLLPDPVTRAAVADYMRSFLELARETGVGFLLESQTWKAHAHWAESLDATTEELRQANRDSISFIAGLRDEFATNAGPIVLNGVIGPRGDGYAPQEQVAAREAEAQHPVWLMVSRITAAPRRGRPVPPYSSGINAAR